MKRLAFVFLLSLSLLALACGGDDSNPPPVDSAGMTPDAPGGTPDANAAAACDDYCTCMGTNCVGSFADTAACMAECATLDPAAIQCRTDHCGFAAGGMGATHCPHAEGDGVTCQ